MPAIPPLV